MNLKRLEAEFDRAIERDMEMSKKLFGKRHGRFLPMFRQYGGVKTAKRLLAAPNPQDWIVEMILKGYPELTCEAKALTPKFRCFFTAKEIKTADDWIGDALRSKHRSKRRRA